VKCDEEKPTCGRCVKKSLDCLYEEPPPPEPKAPRGLQKGSVVKAGTPLSSRTPVTPPITVAQLPLPDISQAYPARPSHSEASGTISPPAVNLPSLSAVLAQTPYSAAYLPTPPETPPIPEHLELSPADTQLLQHYMNNVSAIHRRPTMAHLARTTVVDIASHHPFLLHALLAAAAHIKALSAPSGGPVYFSALAQAAEHENASINLFNNTIPQITRENFEAVFMYTLMTAVFVFASFNPILHTHAPQQRRKLVSSGWIKTLHCTTTIMPAESWTWLTSSPLYGFFYPKEWSKEYLEMPANVELFKRIEREFVKLPALWHGNRHASAIPPGAEMYSTLHGGLLKTVNRIVTAYPPSSVDPEVVLPASVAWSAWIHEFKPAFLDNLDAGHVEPLVLLAYWGVLGYYSQDAYWADGNMGYNLARAVWDELTEQEASQKSEQELVRSGRWREWMQWPMSNIPA
jgi:hypothetical protein